MSNLVDRRMHRVNLSEEDQELINLVRRKFGANDSQKLTPGLLKKALRIEDAYVSARVFAILAGKDRRTLTQHAALQQISAVLLGGDDTKLRFVFDLHDSEGRDGISKTDLKRMLDASLRQNEINLKPSEKRDIVDTLFRRAKTDRKRRINFSEFKSLVGSYPAIRTEMLSSLSDWFGVAKTDGAPANPSSSAVGEKPKRATAKAATDSGSKSDAKSGNSRKSSGNQKTPAQHQTNDPAKKTKRNRSKLWKALSFAFDIVPIAFVRTVLIAGYIGLNAYLAYDAVLRYEPQGIWIQIARAAGAILNLNGALILVPMMRSLIGRLRRIGLGRILAIDHHIDMHRIFGTVLFLAGLIHTGAHITNYVTRGIALDQVLFGTMVGITGVVILGALFFIWVFAQKPVRRGKGFELFYLSHGLYLMWFVAMLLHAPHFWIWASGPLALWVIELCIQRFAKRHKTEVLGATILPGGVTELRFKRPEKFNFQPGDYLYLTIPKLSRFERHPFTISSAPEEKDHLSVHIRSLGNWTKAVRKLFEEKLKTKDHRLPVKLYGPYGTPSNRIFASRHAILIGAGIGVTPFASIMRSILHQKTARQELKLEKLHFFWLNRGQKSFDWFGDMLGDIEERGGKSFFDINIYLTNAASGASGALARIGMELIRKESNRDMTTGLQSKTHFGRPDWDAIFDNIASKRGPNAVSVFFCGPEALGRDIRRKAIRHGFTFRKENF